MKFYNLSASPTEARIPAPYTCANSPINSRTEINSRFLTDCTILLGNSASALKKALDKDLSVAETVELTGIRLSGVTRYRKHLTTMLT